MRNLKRALSLTLASVMLLGMMVVGSSALSFNDADDISNVTAATVLEELGVMQGDGQGNFMPEQTVTRAQMAILICRILYGDKLNVSQFEGTTQYTDVAANAYYTGYINLATQLGIIGGYGDGRFGPDDTVTTAQAALMLSRALGYFKANELATGDWALASVAQATKIDMFGNLKLATNEGLSRDNVCEMVFNTMTKAVPVQYSERWDLYYTDSNNVLGAIKFSYDETLAYRNFDLVYNEGEEDDFSRPATEWGIGTITKALDDKGNIVNKGAIIKTSFVKDVEEADATYTKAVKISDIYKDLGLNSTIPAGDVTVYVDGVTGGSIGTTPQISRAISKADTTNKYGGNGVLTQVYYFPGARTNTVDKIVITEINTYVGEVSRTVAATSSRDAYVVIAADGDSKPAGVGGNLEFETDVSFADEARVLYTYSQDTEDVQSLAVAASASGEATRADNSVIDLDDNKGIVVDGNTYKFSVKAAGDKVGQVSVGSEYDLYLDEYGYVIYLEEVEEIGDYALFLNSQNKNDFSSNRALLVFADGSEKVVDTEKDYKSAGSNKIEPGTIVTYRVDDGVYTLKPVKQTIGTAEITSGAPNYNDSTVAATVSNILEQFKLTNDKAGVVFHSAAAGTVHYTYADPGNGTAKSVKTAITDADALTINANSSTVFVVYNDTDDEYTTYTGIKNVPSIEGAAGKKVAAYTYCKSGSMAKVMFIFVQDGSIIQDEGKDLIFLAGESVSDLIHTKEGDYFEYNAVVGDEITTVKVDESWGNDLNGLYASYASDKNGIITRLTAYTPYDNTTDSKQALNEGVGIDKRSADYTVIMDTAAAKGGSFTTTVDEKANIFAVDEEGKITESSYRAISKDDNDKVYAVVQDWLVKTLIIETVASAPDAEYTLPAVAGVSWNVSNKGFGDDGDPAVAKSGNTIQIKVAADMKPTVMGESGGAISFTNSSESTGEYTFIMPSENIASVTLKSASEYDGEIVFDTTNKAQVTAEWTGARKPTEAELASALIDKLVSQGYDKSTASITKLDNNDVSVKIKKTINGVAGPEDTYKIDPSGGDLVQVEAIATSEALAAKITASSTTKVKLTGDATVTAAPTMNIDVASGKTLTLDTGVTNLTKDITGAGKVKVNGDLATGGEKIEVTGGIEVATGKTLTLGATAITCDITGAGKVSTGANITNGDKIKVDGGLTLAASSSIDKIGNIDVTVTGDTSISGAAAPKSLTWTAGDITVAASGGNLTLPNASLTLGGKLTVNGIVTLGGETTTKNEAANIAVGAAGELRLGDNTLTGGGTSATITVADGGKITGSANKNFYASNTQITSDVEASGASKTCEWKSNADGGTTAGWTVT